MDYGAVTRAMEAMRNAVQDIHAAVKSMAPPEDPNIQSADEQLAVFDEALSLIKSHGPDA